MLIPTWKKLLMAEPRSKIRKTSPVLRLVWNDKDRSRRWLKHILDISLSEYCMTGAHCVKVSGLSLQ